MNDSKNRQVLLSSLPNGVLTASDFTVRHADIPSIGDGEILTRTILISLDAANRAWMQGPTYRQAVKAGDVMHAYVMGEVVDAKTDAFSVGEIVLGEGGWAEYVVMDGRAVTKASKHRPLSNQLSVAGIAGKTAYHGLLKIGEPKEGETLVVSAAAGSVGTFAGQIGKIRGANVVGIAGGADKCAWLVDELGFDGAVDYKAGGLFRDLKAACPNGIDIYFDNVGGAITEAALFQMNLFGRVVCCGAVSQYDTADQASPRGIPGLVVVKRLKMQGFVVLDHADEDQQAEDDLLRWASEGRIKVVEDVVEGLENVPGALIGLLAGENRGKRMVRVAPEP